ncbi:MAG: hypothetical protein D6722_28725 [Bacteroidetes bacterium]|nr:MAG: hypothetical protein D6722_28725 [Bacteroidota bacterium]
MNRTPPLYGRFPLPAVQELSRRLQQVADRFMGEAQFSTYLTTFDDERFYGLDYEELEEVFQRHEGRLRSLTASCSGPDNRSVNLSIRYARAGATPDTQYVIAAASPFENREISRMLQGEWQAPQKEIVQARAALAALIAQVQAYLVAKADAQPLETEPGPESRRVRPQAGPKPPPREVRLASAITTVRDKFAFDDNIAIDVLIDLLQDVSAQYLEEAPFNIRLITTDGEPYSDIGTKGLRRFFEKRRSLVLKVFMDAATSEGELVDLVLSFGPRAPRLNAEVEVSAVYSREIQTIIRERLEQSTVEFRAPQASMVHEMFRFDEARFSIEAVLRLVQVITSRHLQGEKPTVYLSTNQGKTYPSLTLDQARNMFYRHQGQVSFLLFGVNAAVRGQTFSLMFQFQSPGHEAYGSLSMMWGDEETHNLIRGIIWDQLKLKSYQGGGPRPQSPNPPISAVERHPAAFPTDATRIQPRTALVLMPLEAYWSESLWHHLQEVMTSIGWSSQRSEALFSKDTLDEIWEDLARVELIIADVTYKHPGVFYQAGVAHSLGKRVIFITQHARDLPADFRRFSHIVYDNNIFGLQNLAERLIEQVRVG